MQSFDGLDERIFEERDGGWVVEQIATHLQSLMGDRWHTPTFMEQVTGVPDCAKAILYCWAFQCEVAGNGLYDLLINQKFPTSS